nr:immunoglobulin heavy chain junction region [Mus musculus]
CAREGVFYDYDWFAYW